MCTNSNDGGECTAFAYHQSKIDNCDLGTLNMDFVSGGSSTMKIYVAGTTVRAGWCFSMYCTVPTVV